MLLIPGVDSNIPLYEVVSKASLNEVDSNVSLNKSDSNISLKKVNGAVDEYCGCRFNYCQRCLEVFKPSPIYLNESTRDQLDEDDLILEQFKQLVQFSYFL